MGSGKFDIRFSTYLVRLITLAVWLLDTGSMDGGGNHNEGMLRWSRLIYSRVGQV